MGVGFPRSREAGDPGVPADVPANAINVDIDGFRCSMDGGIQPPTANPRQDINKDVAVLVSETRVQPLPKIMTFFSLKFKTLF